RVNRSALPAGRSLAELVAAVYFGPDELALVKGAPEGRRRFLDDLVVKVRPARDGLRREWERVLRQRNAALRTVRARYGGRPDDTLSVWTESFCRVGAALVTARLEVLDALQPLVAERYGSIAGAGEVEIAYASSWLLEPERDVAALESRLTEATGAVAAQEIERGQSLIGPQRDDFSVVIRTPEGAAIEARTHASQGDQRTCALALKLAEHDVLAAALGEQPILLLDDVFSELDPTRRAWLAKNVAELDQALVTTTAAEDLDLAGVDVIYEIAGGTVIRR
ncbi:MAG TPA: DNA replication and repair protein RecF, partial [Vicinamibacterales bacterium]|nr:DNA replication and repair protein RecF [Vicinamibacterales bacterium]